MLTVITGPPCGGKSTYARAHAKPGDIVLDFDTIAQALGSPATHDHDKHIAEVAAAAWSAAIERAIREHRKGCRAWIVDTAPTSYRRRLYTEAGARTVTCTADRDELHRRADDTRPPSWHHRIDQYLDNGREPAARPRTAW
jgi:hypothetical protein